MSSENDSHIVKNKKCKLCEGTFSKNSEFETHMVEEHNVEKSFECEFCGKTFLLEWRLKKHKLIHTEKPKRCKYFQNNQFCPFEKVGCMFDHSCKATEPENIEDIEEDGDDEDDEDDHDYMPRENQCHLCKKQLTTRDELWEHVEQVHVEYFQGVLEVARANTGRLKKNAPFWSFKCSMIDLLFYKV